MRLLLEGLINLCLCKIQNQNDPLKGTNILREKVLPASQVSTTTSAWQKNACNLFWQGRILWLGPAVEWTVLLFHKISKERRKIGGQAGGGKERIGGKGLFKYLTGMDRLIALFLANFSNIYEMVLFEIRRG